MLKLGVAGVLLFLSAPPADLFVDVTQSLGIRFNAVATHTSKKYLLETMGSGVAVFDYDNDGRLDLYFVNGAPLSDPTAPGSIPAKTNASTANRLYHQKADGSFEDVTEKAGVAGIGFGMGTAVGDFDNDGYEDLFVTAYGGNMLYHNNGNGTFTNIAKQAGVVGEGWSTSAAWVDLNNDGRLDLVVLRYLQWDFNDVFCGEHTAGGRAYCHPDLFRPIRPLVYRNDGNGHFTEVGEAIGISKPGKGLGITLADYDRDGKIDLFIANDSMVQFLYHNLGNGTFEEVGLPAQVAVDEDGQTFAGMGTELADYDNDGYPDLIVDDLANQKYALYRNSGDGTFSYQTGRSGLGRITLLHSGWGLRFFDYDNDGWKDLIVAQGHDLDTIEKTNPQLHYREPLLLLKNNGKTFDDVSGQAGNVFQQRWASRGLAIGDLNNDGRLDVVVSTNNGPAYVLKNQVNNGNHWIGIELTGHKSNRDGIGAEIKVSTPQMTQYGTVSTTGSYLSSSDRRIYFGLAKNSEAQNVEIRWPSGIVQKLVNVKADEVVKVQEPAR